MAILEAEKANDKAADVPVDSANLEGYEVHLTGEDATCEGEPAKKGH